MANFKKIIKKEEEENIIEIYRKKSKLVQLLLEYNINRKQQRNLYL